MKIQAMALISYEYIKTAHLKTFEKTIGDTQAMTIDFNDYLRFTQYLGRCL